MRFSFVKHPILHLLDHHYEIFVGVQKIVAIYTDDSKGKLKGIIKNQQRKEELNISNFTEELEKYRIENSSFSWFDESSLPFKVRQTGIFQQEIFDELEKTVLLLKLPSRLDGKRDLLFIYFDKNLSHLSSSSQQDAKLNGVTKPLIAKLLLQSVISIISDANHNQEILKENFNPNTQAIIQSHKALESQLTVLDSRFNNTFVKLIKNLFYKYLDNSIYSISLSDKVINKLIDFNGNYEELEEIIKNTVDYLNTLYLDKLPEQIIIEDYFINTSIHQDNKFFEETNRYTKTILLLDNLNDAVKLVLKKNQNPTGLTVGQAMQKPISAPAITDALKNHKSRILTLIDQYPNRWIELKQYFKPIQNISTNSKKFRITS